MLQTRSPAKKNKTNMEENKGDSAARPFQLRPSILSGTGFGAGGIGGGFGSGPDKSNKEFTLRPSALSSAADQLETNVKTKETRKRLHDEDTEDLPSTTQQHKDEEEEEEITKKVKVSGELDTSKSPIKLTEDLQKPAGIGTFGFGGDNDNPTNNDNDNLGGGDGSTNSFSASGKNEHKNFFVFGNNSNSTSVGFNTIKNEKTPTEDNDDDDDTSSRNGVTSAASASGGGGDVTAATTTEHDKEKLLENACEYQLTHAHKTHLHEVEQITGEEGERNVLQVFCKLHLFDKPKGSWVEKGRGTLKLNDRCHSEGVFQSRLVFRTQGTNIVLLNMMLFPEMCCERVKEKSIRITSVDAETKEAKIYLITTSIKDSLQTYIAVDRRITALKRSKSGDTKDRQSDSSDREKLNATEDEDSSTESERLSSRENSMYGPTDDSDHQTSPSPET